MQSTRESLEATENRMKTHCKGAFTPPPSWNGLNSSTRLLITEYYSATKNASINLLSCPCIHICVALVSVLLPMMHLPSTLHMLCVICSVPNL